jgi:hypothetical protein
VDFIITGSCRSARGPVAATAMRPFLVGNPRPWGGTTAGRATPTRPACPRSALDPRASGGTGCPPGADRLRQHTPDRVIGASQRSGPLSSPARRRFDGADDRSW